MPHKHKDKLTIAVLQKHFTMKGGSEKYSVEICNRLRDRGHHLHIYTRAVDNGLGEGMSIFRVRDRLKFSSALNLYAFARDTAATLQACKHDLIHSHERGFQQDVLTLHCFSHISGLKKYSLLRQLDQRYLSPRNALYLWLEKKQMATHWLIAVSNTIKNDVKINYDRSENIAVIPPGVDTEWFHPDSIALERASIRKMENISDDELVIVFVGSEFKRKGLDNVISTLGSRMRLYAVGRGDNRDHYQQMIKKLNLGTRVYFTGLVDDVRKYYALADVVILLSISEAFGMSVLEGMACGLPVITTANCGVADLIEEGVNGFVLTNPNGLKNILSRLHDSGLRESIGKAARKTAENHTWDSVANAHEELYYKIVESNKKN